MSKKNQGLSNIDAPIYSYWQALYMAFYSSRLYVDVAIRWRGLGILYMLILIVIVSTPLSVRLIIDFKRYFDEQLLLPLESLPPLYVQNGNVIFDKPMPYPIKNKGGEVVAMIDTTGKMTGIGSTYPKLTILVTKDKIYFRSPQFRMFFNGPKPTMEGSVFNQSFGKESNGVFIGKKWVVSSGILKVKYITEFLIYPVLALFWFSMYTIFMIALAFIAQLFTVIIFKYRPKFKDACRIFLVASTAQVVLYFTLITANVTVPGGGLLYMIVIAVYFNYAIISIKRASNKMVRT